MSSFNNPGFEPRDLNNDDTDTVPFTIPDYEEISPIVKSSEKRYQSQRKSSSRREKDPLYAEVGPSLESKVRETPDHQHDGETHLRQASNQAFERTHQATGSLSTQIHNDIAKHHGRELSYPTAASNLTYQAFLECKPENGNISFFSNNKDRHDKAKREKSLAGEQRVTLAPRRRNPETGYSSLGKREFHKDALKREEPHYSKPSDKLFGAASTLDSSVDDGRNKNFYAPMGMSLVQPNKGNEFDGYAQLDPSSLINKGKGKDLQKNRSSKDQSHHVSTVHPKLENHGPKRSAAFDDAEDNGSFSGKKDTAMKKDRSQSSKTKASGHLVPAEERMEYENQSYGHPRSIQKAWNVNPRYDDFHGDTAEKSSQSHQGKARASSQFDLPDEHTTGDNYSRDPRRNNQDDWDKSTRNGEVDVLYLTSELGPDETTI